MINAQVAFETAQKVNIIGWLKEAVENLSNQILAAANMGYNHVIKLDKTLIIGW